MKIKSAYTHEQYSKVLNHAKERLLTLVTRAPQQSWSQAKMLIERTSIFAELPKYPYALSAEVKGYADALDDIIKREQIVFLYCVNDALYTTHLDPVSGLQPWSVLPLEMQSQLGDCGGFYWKHSLKLFYKAGSTT